MKVLFIQIARESNPEYSVHELFAEQSYTDVDSYFFCQRPHNQPTLPASSTRFYFDAGRDISLTPAPSRPKRAWLMATGFARSLPAMASHIARIRPDALYTSQQRWDLLVARGFSRLFNIPHIIHLHYAIGPWLGRDALHILRGAPHLLACSDFVASTAREHDVTQTQIERIYNPIELGASRAVRRETERTGRDSTRAAFGIAQNAPLVLAVGRLVPGKGYRQLIHAFARVQAEIADAHLLICGAAEARSHYRDELERLVQAAGLRECVTFAGYRPDILHIMAAADVFCLPALHEAFGLVFTEAMSMELPVVACTSGATAEIVQHGETGLLAKPDSAEEISQHLLTLLRNPALVRRMGRAGRQRVETVFAVEKLAPRWRSFLSKHVKPSTHLRARELPRTRSRVHSS